MYNANGDLLCTWEDSGINVETHYTSFTYKTSTTSPYYVMTNSYPSATKVVIPYSVTSIGSSAFRGCSNLTNVTFKNTSNWYVGSSVGDKKTAISSSDLSDTSTAATYLKSTYAGKYWTHR